MTGLYQFNRKSFTGCGKSQIRQYRLALAELEAAPCAPLAVLFPFHHPGITGKEPVIPQGNRIPLIYLAKRPCQTMTAGSGLAVGTPSVHIDKHVKLAFIISYYQRLAYHHYMFTLGKILDQLFTVYHDLSRTVPNINPCNRSFSSSRANSKILYHKLPLTD
jgi:hypothetical protein